MAGTAKIREIMTILFLVCVVQEVSAQGYFSNLGAISNTNFGPIGNTIQQNIPSGLPSFGTYQPPIGAGFRPASNPVPFRPASYGLRPDRPRPASPNVYNRVDSIPYKNPTDSLSCETDALTCVPKADCGDDPLNGTRQCPPMWRKIGGACYFLTSPERVRSRSQPDARQYCKDIGGRLAWFESENEMKAVNRSVEQVPFWTDGVYNKKREIWFWENDWVELIFKKLDGGRSNYNPAITSPTEQRLCLSINETGFTPATCYEPKSFVCKMGNYENRCENSLGRCCWSPSYQYYSKYIIGNSGLSSDMARETEGPCFVLFNKEVIKCTTAYAQLRTLPTFRIEKSIYYLNTADTGCSASREAIISTEEIHSTIVKFLMTVEKMNYKIKIGLVIKPTDTGSTLLWVNGKSHSYYKNEYWAVGHPKMHGLSGCIMYMGTGTDGSGAYLWHTIDNDDECKDATNMVLCEIPIRNTDFQPVKKSQPCGIRFSGGVLGRSFSSGNDFEEARFGEWPWQAAIMNTRNFYLGVGQEFVCSGVLLSHDVVLTSAHCVQDLDSEALLVSLGDYDLEAVNQRKLLEPLVVKVREVVEYPDYVTGKDDIAILQLAESVAYIDMPHINVGCLPSQRILYAGGDWECFVTGWPQASYGSGRRLQRIEVDFVPRTLCKRQTRRRRYDSYGRPLYPYQTDNTISEEDEPELLCVEPWDTNTCLADSTTFLVCKKNIVYDDDPFKLGGEEDAGFYGQITPQSQPQYNQPGSSQSFAESTKVINAYGQNRFNEDKYYVIGVGHDSNSCSTPGYMVFTPVHEYLYFIHSIIDETSASGLDGECACPDY